MIRMPSTANPRTVAIAVIRTTGGAGEGASMSVIPGPGPPRVLVLLRKQEPRITSVVVSGSGLLLSQEHGFRIAESVLSGQRRVCAHQLREKAFVHRAQRSEEHKSELQSLMRISNAVFCLKKQK